mgnify:CR=1 FL=1
MKKKIYLFVSILLLTNIVNAKFVLTPYDGLKTPDGVYTIMREGSTVEQNYKAMISAVKMAIPNVTIREFEQEQYITVMAETTVKLKFKDVFTQSKKFNVSYVLKINAEKEKITLDFEQLGNFTISKFGSHYTLYPTIGRNNAALQSSGLIHVFNSSGETTQEETKKEIEEWANTIVSQIEIMLKEMK